MSNSILIVPCIAKAFLFWAYRKLLRFYLPEIFRNFTIWSPVIKKVLFSLAHFFVAILCVKGLRKKRSTERFEIEKNQCEDWLQEHDRCFEVFSDKSSRKWLLFVPTATAFEHLIMLFQPIKIITAVKQRSDVFQWVFLLLFQLTLVWAVMVFYVLLF